MRLAYGFILSLCLFALPAAAQKHDYVWLSGYDSEAEFDQGWNYWFGVSRFDFTEDTTTLSYDSLGINFDRCNATISDKDGNLLFYTNGITIRNSFDEVICDSIGFGYFYSGLFPSYLTKGVRYNNAGICVPLDNGINGVYKYYRVFFDTVPFTNFAATQIKESVIDVTQNAGHGSVVVKDLPVITEWVGGASISAVKHGNGRDWWIISREMNGNCYNLLLSSFQNQITYHAYCGGQSIPSNRTSVMDFSNDGNWIVSASNQGDLNVFTFDRCNGHLNLFEEVDLTTPDDTVIAPHSIEFSPDSRYLYIFGGIRVYQYDMTALPIASSKKIIATLDTFTGPFLVDFHHGQLAPDGKIYINASSTNYYIGVINQPNNSDTLCQLKQHSIQTPSFISGLQYYPNYRLGAVPGSPCDTLTSLAEIPQDKLLHVYPNPATDNLFADYGYLPWDKYQNDITLQITDAIGRVVYTQPLPRYSGIQKLDVRAYPQGIYYLSLLHNQQTLTTRKWVKGE